MRTATIQAIFEEAVRLSPEGVTFRELVGGRQGGTVTRVRQRAILAVRLLRPDLSLNQIGAAISKDHSSVLFAARREQELVKADAQEAQELDRLVACFPPLRFDDLQVEDRLAAAETALMDALSAIRVARNAVVATRAAGT